MRAHLAALPLIVAILAGWAAHAQPGLLEAAAARPAGPPPTLPSGFFLEDVSGGAPFDLPVAVAFAADGRMFVVEKRGVVWVVRDGERRPEPFLDLRDEVLNSVDRGMLGIALDPRFDENGQVYVAYTVDVASTGDSARTDAFGRVTRYASSADDADRADAASRRVLLGATFSTGIPACFFSHSPATLAFGRDGSLLVGTGDAASFFRVDDGGEYPDCFGPGRLDPSEDIGAFRALRLESLAGKILRVDPETGLGLPSNPFFTGDPAANASRVWAYGLRNPFRFTVRPRAAGDAGPGTLVVGDVGWLTWEELDVVRGGESFGWPCEEGPLPQTEYRDSTHPATNGCDVAPPAAPAAAYYHHFRAGDSSPPGWTGQSVIGGAFYTGGRYPEAYRGAYFYTDFSAGWMAVARFDEGGGLVDVEPFSDDVGAVVQVAYDSTSQALHLVDIASGRVLRLRHASEGPPSPSEGPPSALGIRGLYPNPASSRVTLLLAVDRPGRVTVDVLDILGRRVLLHGRNEAVAGVQTVPLDVAHLPAGTYLVRIRDESGAHAGATMAVVR